MCAVHFFLGCAWAVLSYASPVSAAVLVSNINQPNSGLASLDTHVISQEFTTGSNTAGYTLESVEVNFQMVPSGVTVKLATGTFPGLNDEVTLTNPSSFSTGVNTFTDSSETRLKARTTYFVVIEGSSGKLRTTSSHAENGVEPEWSIEDEFIWTRKPPNSGSGRNNEPVKLRINGTVRVGPSEESIQTTNSILTAVGAQVLSSALENIGGRLGDSLPQTSLSLTGFQVPLSVSGEPDHSFYERCHFDCDDRSDTPRYRSIDSDDILHASEFPLNLGATEGEADPLAPHWSVWGRAGLASFKGRPTTDGHYDGSANSGWFGIDARAGSWVAGVALSRTSSGTDYRLDASGDPERLKTSLTALYPYGRWALDEESAVHAIVGIGSGEVLNVLDGSTQEQSDLSMRMLSVGLQRQLPPFAAWLEGMELSGRVEASLMRLKTEAGDESIDGLSPELQRIRLGLEGSRRIVRDDGTVIVPFFDLAARRDSGDGLEGFGLEVAGGVQYSADRVQFEFRGRALLTHSGRGVKESGLSVTARYLPEADGSGLSLSFRPHWGIATDGATALWQDEMPQPSLVNAADSFDARIGYGFALPPGGGVLTPFAEISHAGSDARLLRVGTRFDAPLDRLALELSGQRRENAADAAPEDSIRFDFSHRF